MRSEKNHAPGLVSSETCSRTISKFAFVLLIAGTIFLQPSAVWAKKSAKVAPVSGSWKAAVAEGNRRLERKEFELAEVCFREAWKDVRKDKEASADDRVVCLEHLASVLQSEDLSEEALHLYRKSLKIIQKEHGKNSEATVPSLTVLGDIDALESEYHRAALNYGDALTILAANPELHAQRIADLRHRLGFVVSKAGDNILALQLYSEALNSLMKQKVLTGSNLLESILADYSDTVYKSLGKRQPSAFQQELLKDEVGIGGRTRNVQDSHWTNSVAARFVDSNFASKMALRGGDNSGVAPNSATSTPPASDIALRLDAAKHQEAPLPSVVPLKSSQDNATLAKINAQRADFYKRMIAVDIKTLGPDHPSVARDLSGLAHIYLSQNNTEEAKLLLQRALKIYQSNYSSNPQLVKRTELMLTLIDRKQNALQNEVAPFKEYASTLPSVPLEAQKLEIALRLNYLGLLLFSEGRIGDAEKVYAWAVATTAAACGEQSTMAGSALVDYAKVLKSADRRDLADRYDASAEQIFSAALAKQTASLLP